MADITEQTFPKISIDESDALIYCFRHVWRYGLFFDLGPGIGQPLDVIGLPRQLGHANRHVVFFDDYSAYRAAQGLGLIEDGWFPFIQLLGGEFRHLVDIYGQDDRDILVDQFVRKYTGSKVAEIVEGWWEDELFASKKEILLSGLEAFNSETPSGAILCIKTFLSEIDGVVRLKFQSDNIAMARPRQSALLDFIATKASEKFDTYSPAFPEAFFTYLKNTIFADFDLAANDIPLSRHSAAHGVAAAETYTRVRALQAILAMDQLFFYLAKTPESGDAKQAGPSSREESSSS